MPLEVVVLPHATQTPIGRNEVELQIASVGDPIQTSEVGSIGVVGVNRICSNEGAGVIFILDVQCVAVLSFALGLVAVFDFLVGHDGGFLGVIVALQVTLLFKHEMSFCTVWTSSSLVFTSGVSPMTSREFPASILESSLHYYL